MTKTYGQDTCAIAAALEVIGDRWTLLIIRELMGGRRRFSEIRSALPGIAPNLLSQRLRALTDAGIAGREQFAEIPPRVEYSLTRSGQALRPVLLALLRWGLLHSPAAGSAAFIERCLSALPLVARPPAGPAGTVFIDAGEAGTWTVALADGHVQSARGEAAPAGARIHTTPQVLASVIGGASSLANAIEAGSARVEGDHHLALALGQLLGPHGE